jgi:excisionase family DNA binding protein
MLNTESTLAYSSCRVNTNVNYGITALLEVRAMSEDEKPFLTIPEVAAMIGVSSVRAYQMAAQGSFPCVRLSPRRLRVPRAAFRSWLDSQTALALANVK